MDHKILSKDIEARKGVCSVCGPVDIRKKSKGGGRFKWVCRIRKAEKDAASGQKRQRYSIVRSPRCDRCGFVPEHLGQLEVDHIVRRTQGGSNEPDNLWTLCANCHRLKSILETLPGFDFEAFQHSSTQDR